MPDAPPWGHRLARRNRGGGAVRRRHPLGNGANLVRFALVRPGDDPHLFFWTAAAPIAIGASSKGIHIVSSWRGLFYELLSWTGKPLDEIQVFLTRLPLYSVAF